MKAFLFGILSFVFLQLAFAQSHRPLIERITDLENEMIAIQDKIKELEKNASPSKERKALRDSIRFKLPEFSFLIYEYGYEIERPIDYLRIFNLKLRLNMISETLSTIRPPNTGLIQPEHPIEPLFGVREDIERTKDLLLIQDYPLEKKFDKRLRETKNIQKLLYAWMDDKNLNVVKDYVIKSPTMEKNSTSRRALQNYEIPLEIIHDVKTFDQFQILRSFVEARYKSRNPADWDWFNVLLSEVKTKERTKLAAVMIFSKEKDWDLKKIIDALRMTRDPDVIRPRVPRKNLDEVLIELGIKEKEPSKMELLRAFFKRFDFEPPQNNCRDLLL
jgi:hypothetical protein